VSSSALWQRLLEHVGGAHERVVLIAPFVKQDIFKELLAAVPAAVQEITCVTRWSAAEIAAGVSDPEIYAIAAADGRAKVRLCPLLHAKIYVADTRALVGSANLTNSALGRIPMSNIEILINADPASADVADAINAVMDESVAATSSLAERLRAEADLLLATRGALLSEQEQSTPATWVPQTRDPSQLYPVYAGASVPAQKDLKQAVMNDLMNLGLAAGFSEQRFRRAVADRLRQMPGVESFASEGRVTSAVLEAAVTKMLSCSADEAKHRSATIAEWIQYFDKAVLVPVGEWELRRKIG